MNGQPLLPEELQIEIFLRLPVKTLLRFMAVCDKWRSLITRPTFNTRYSCISHARNSSKLIWFHRDPIEKTHVLSLIDCETTKTISNLEWPPFQHEGLDNQQEFDRAISILGPINGIYCIFNRLINRWAGTITLWNPATRDYKHIVPPICFPFSFEFINNGKWRDHWYYERKAPRAFQIGFGFDDKRNDFKVVVLCHWEARYGYHDDRWHVRVYNLSIDSWRTIYYIKTDKHLLFDGMVPFFDVFSYPDIVHCYLNGIIHWATGAEPGGHILALDIATEHFQLIKGPPLPEYDYPCTSVWVLKETIAMTFTTLEENKYPSGTLVWMMMEYGIEDSWRMLYSFGPISGLAIIGIPNDNHIFFSDVDGQLTSSNFEDQVLNGFGVYGVRDIDIFSEGYGSQGVLGYVETFESLNPI